MAVLKYQDKLQQTKKKRRRIKAAAFLSGALLFTGGAVCLLFFAGFFEVGTIVVIGADQTITQQVEQTVANWLAEKFLSIERRKNFYFLSRKKLEALILSGSSLIKSVEIETQSPRDLKILLEERTPMGVWCQSDGVCFLFDQDGVAYQNASLTEGMILITVKDMRKREIAINHKVDQDEYLAKFSVIKKELRLRGVGVIEFIIPEQSPDEFHSRISYLVAGQSFKTIVYFNLESDPQKQASDLLDLFSEKLSDSQRRNIEYLDLRIPGRVYYKLVPEAL
jgi:cell division septal protein FtsQ